MSLGRSKRRAIAAGYFTRAEPGMQEITRLLQLAASSVALLTVPELDPPDESNSATKAATQPSSTQSTPPPGSPEIIIGQRIRLPQGDERAERFVAEVTEYYQKLDVRTLHIERAYKAHAMSHSSSNTLCACSWRVSAKPE